MSLVHEQDLASLAALDVLLEERSVTRAAKRLGVTQSAVSHKLRGLRERFADPLLVGTRGELVLTDRARALQPPLRAALRALREAVHVGEAFDPRTSTRRFVVATNDYGEALFLPRVLARMRTLAPDVTVTCEPVTREVFTRLEGGSLDVAVIGPVVELPPSIMKRNLHTEDFVVLMRKGHALATAKLTEKRYLSAGHALIAPSGRPGGVIDDWLAQHGKVRRVVVRVAHFMSAPHLIVSSDLLLTAPRALAEVACKHYDVVAVPLPFNIPKVTASLAWHARAQREGGHRFLRSMLLASDDA